MTTEDIDARLVQETMRIIGENVIGHSATLRRTANECLQGMAIDYRIDVLVIPFAFDREADLKACIIGDGKIYPEMIKAVLAAMLKQVSQLADTPEATHGGDSRTH